MNVLVIHFSVLWCDKTDLQAVKKSQEPIRVKLHILYLYIIYIYLHILRTTKGLHLHLSTFSQPLYNVFMDFAQHFQIDIYAQHIPAAS